VPLPGWLARFNRRATNRLTGSFAGRLPGFAIITHEGRRSGRRHRTPVNIFRSGDDFVIALTYGRQRDWVRNVMAAGGCEIETQGITLHLRDPLIVTDASQTLVPFPVRPILRAIGVTEFMKLSPLAQADGGSNKVET
jgi:deazaflavin-dependent oxidoreductase (nitroreductase family)